MIEYSNDIPPKYEDESLLIILKLDDGFGLLVDEQSITGEFGGVVGIVEIVVRDLGIEIGTLPGDIIKRDLLD